MSTDGPADERNENGRPFDITLPKVFFLLELAAATLFFILFGLFAWNALDLSQADPMLQGAILSGILLLFSLFAYREAKKRW